LGSQYVLDLKAVNCASGDTLAEQQMTVASEEKVLDALGEAASELRGELGESLATVHRFDVRLAQATTSSLEALKVYSSGYSDKISTAEAIAHDQHAVELDPNIALAYSAMGMSYNILGEIGRARDYYTRHSSCGIMPANAKSWRSPPTTIRM
jgi:tetratricopeptide (TPR) repeat protein